ncbi:MAG: glycosyltransferase family 2 protein [Bacteroidales bacterium]|nr:glycosyltransferase family 2 protein [Bacteroidales bacterium]
MKQNKTIYYICAIAKDEQLYLYDWVKYHIDKGIDKIIIYNNGFSDYYIYDMEQYVEFIPWHPKSSHTNPQTEAYNDFINKHKGHGIACFIDIDEFIWGELPKRGNIVLEDITYDACGNLFYDNRPVYERFTREAVLNMTCNIKTVVDLSNPGQFISCHRTNMELETIDGIIIPDHNIPFVTSRASYLRHYLTKSLEEYIQKLKRGNITKGLRTLDYFFKVNPDMLPRL